MKERRAIAYFSMEIGLDPAMPTYSGGLGVLAGDTIRSAADLEVPMVGVTLLHRRGYFRQRLDQTGWQKEEPEEWVIGDFLEEMPPRISVIIEGRTVQVRAWKFDVRGVGGFIVPVYFLDTDLPENDDWDRTLTHFLYGGDERYRLCQEAILGIGGVKMLRALGSRGIERFHMNEGHSSFLTWELLQEEARKGGRSSIIAADIEAVREKCVFTTHTPVPAGHDKFPIDLVKRVLGSRGIVPETKDLFCHQGLLNMTCQALNMSRYVNGVAKKHGEVSSLMFAGYSIDAITNGVHAGTWTSGSFQELYDRYFPGWREDNFSLRYALTLPREDVWEAHQKAKKALIERVRLQAGIAMDPGVLTIGSARRATSYKRGDLVFLDLDGLRSVIKNAGPLQVVLGGKAHPRDQAGKELVQRIFQAIEALRNEAKIAYLENYDMELGKAITSGVDLWLNTPQPPLEASGTSGMKAALNGVPSLSVLDGWWIEGHLEGVTGWSIGETGSGAGENGSRSRDASSLYGKLEHVILPLFYRDRSRYLDVMRNCIAVNGSFFNTQRMVQQYVLKAYFR
ncbi:MAG: alpha-glucan family phosphorylase [Candidatus Aminicenantales bacterium]